MSLLIDQCELFFTLYNKKFLCVLFFTAIYVNDYVYECNNRILNLIQIELNTCIFLGPRQSSDKKNYGSMGRE